MATKSASRDVRTAARKLAAPFWRRVEEAGFDRFFVERMLRSLLRRFREDRFARVKQGGLHGDARAELSRVFIDLDATSGMWGGLGGDPGESERIVASWMRPTNKEPRSRDHRDIPGLERRASVPLEVVLGGPGQGKSTVGRFLVLIHASILLLTSPIEDIAPPADLQRMEALLAGLRAEQIPLPDTLRLPVWIELRELTDALLRDSESERDALRAMVRWYATTQLREGDDAALLEKALASLPWVVVFDGLDEVPPEGGRALVRACVAGVRGRFADANGQIIGTSRPQSYDRQVFGDGLVERTLQPLTPERATLYMERIAECLYPDGGDEHALLLKRMHRALANDATAALMRNPLLVTIMATVVIHHGEPSDRRWTLFEDYYGTLYRRETERGTYASATLRDHASLIDAIHRHVGISLQARSERNEGVSALMPEGELRAIIHERLLESFREDEATRLAAEILRAAEQRLVFLVQAQEGMYGFELRSFQEFMAAWAVVTLREAQTDALLRKLAPLDAWRNVVLLAIGHEYAKSSPLAKERSVGLCASLDSDGDITTRLALPGARLALALLEEAPYGKASGPRDALALRALELLRIPPEGIHVDLADWLWHLNPEQFLDALDSALQDPARAETAWLMLLTAPASKRVHALANRHWPASQDARRAIVRVYTWWADTILWEEGKRSSWVLRKIAKDPTLDPSGELQLLNEMDQEEKFFVYSKLSVSAPRTIGWSCGSIKSARKSASKQARHIPTAAPWAILRASEAFRADVSAARLADVLDDLASAWSKRSLWQWNHDMPWPLLACLIAAQSAQELRATAQQLRRKELGDRARWTEIEKASPRIVTVDHVKTMAISADPLRAMLVDGLLMPFDRHHATFYTELSATVIVSASLREFDEARRSAMAPWVKRMLAQLELELLGGHLIPIEDLSVASWLTADDLAKTINEADVAFDLTLLESLAPALSMSELISTLMRTNVPIVATSWRFRGTLHTISLALADALRAAPDSERLQRALVAALQFEARHGRTPAIALKPIGSGRDTWLLRCISGHATREDVPTLVRLLAKASDEDELRASLVLLAGHEHSREIAVLAMEALLALPNVAMPLRSEAVQFIANQIAHVATDLIDPARWIASGLPAPPPMLEPPERPDTPGAQIASIEISNLRAFPQRFEVVVPAPTESGQWLVFLGENAMGKTTLLRAIALALASQSDASAVPSNLEGPLRRDALSEGIARVRTTDSRELTTTISGLPGDERVVVAPEGTPRPWVVGYGCRRGSAVSGTDMDNAFAPFRDLDNLFDRPRGVVRTSGWLKELQRLAKNNGSRSRMVFEAARAALRKILLGAEDVIVADEVQIEFADRRHVPLALLSDGYLTTAGWVVDLMARWLKRNEGRKGIDENFCAAMEGVVLLDEIDLHLHPRWQERAMEDVRALFPRMTFVATTHHPLTLRGARKGEIFVLGDHDGSGSVTAIQRDIPPGTRVDELITGEWFNRPSAIVDAETRAMLDDHQRLILAGAKAGDPKRKALEAKLRERLGHYADTSLERLAATIVAQHLDESLPEPSAQKREEVRARVLEILKRRDAKRG